MNQLQVINHNGQRVLSTAQLAESFGTETKIISKNFERNESRYSKDKHFFLLEGDELRAFKASRQNDVSPNINCLYFWTEKGAWLHAKSLNTDKAWEAYESLVDDYYRIKDVQALDTSALSPQLQLLINMEQGLKQIEQRQQQTEQQLTTIKETFLKRDENWRSKINGMLNGSANRMGGHQEVRRESYRLLEERAKCNLGVRLTNLHERLTEQGVTKTKIKDTNRLDVIESEPRLKEIYTTIVKELAIGTLI
ncbi:ORF6N domain-containing protein [Paenibacillus antarcticus]|uniref:Antirepressor n=1 Tax=Paenibacillus antarcticus TaxID=253703 RepID=A0A168R2C5_9BACL|nr:ORF6N domain-containing protein [Paenibacillus antarcticus]OAB48498.1 antirepressor [Paenibacillus antarcticus]